MTKPPDGRNLVRPLTTSRRSFFSWAFANREGDLRTTVLVAVIVGLLVVLGLGSFAALLAAGAGSPETLAIWVGAAFLFIKVPILLVMWWVISRRRDPTGGGGWSTKECSQILGYLETQAHEAQGRPDAATRLRYFAREAWFVADRADDADKGAAVETAVMIDAMAAAAGAPPAGRAAPPKAH